MRDSHATFVALFHVAMSAWIGRKHYTQKHKHIGSQQFIMLTLPPSHTQPPFPAALPIPHIKFICNIPRKAPD